MHSEPADTPKPVGYIEKSFPELVNEGDPKIDNK